MTWTPILADADLADGTRTVVRVDGRQILVLRADGQLYASANRCPHEGYPLSEGTLEGCVLTCNWHNWKFDLDSGATLVGGDRLRRYPTRVAEGRIWLDLAEPPLAERREAILAAVAAALDDQDEPRLARETARLVRIGADPLDAVRRAVAWGAERLEFGMTHAFAGAADWLALAARPGLDPDRRLAALVEVLSHIADDSSGGRRYPFPDGTAPWSEDAFVAAVEAQDEAGAVARLRGALDTGADVGPALARAALAHYQDFGHSLIYAVKAPELIGRLGRDVAAPVLFALARSLVYASRENLIPEFRSYAARLAQWGAESAAAEPLAVAALDGCNAARAMAVVAGWSGRHEPAAIYRVLLEALAAALLDADEQVFVATDGKLADNVGWLDFTHGLTFANALRRAASATPALWPAGLLQMACFLGRNVGYRNPAADRSGWAVADPAAFLAEETDKLFDHGYDRFILAVHRIKTLTAVAAEAAAVPEAAPVLWAALNRYLQARLKRRHLLRTARQMRAFVEQE